jgi:hypothetical protein
MCNTCKVHRAGISKFESGSIEYFLALDRAASTVGVTATSRPENIPVTQQCRRVTGPGLEHLRSTHNRPNSGAGRVLGRRRANSSNT